MPWGVVGAAVSGGLSLLGGARANRSRRKEARRDRTFQAGQSQLSRDFTAGQARRSMEFSERMRNTEWQAGIADMQAAGINPALAYSQGGASAPMGAQGSGSSGSGSRANQEDVLSGAVSSAMQYKRLNAEITAIKAGVAKTRAETEAVRGRPGRILEPAVDRGVDAARALFTGDEAVLSPRNMRIMRYELGSSAKQIHRLTKEAVNRFRRVLYDRFRGQAIGPNVTRRR